MSRQEAPMSSKRFIRNVARKYKVNEFAGNVANKLYPPLSHDEEALTRRFSDYFSSAVQNELIDKGASFSKIRDVYEKTISSLIEPVWKEDPLSKRIAHKLIMDGEHVLLRLNSEFDSDEWYEAQREIVYPGVLHFPRKSDSVYS